MRTLSFAAAGIAFAGASVASAQYSSLAPAASSTVTIHAARMIDGHGKETANVLVTVRDGRIASVASAEGSANATYELGDATLLPGLIDAHVHPGWYINRKGALHDGRDGDTPTESALARAGNLYETLKAGFTTIQSVGGVEDLDLRDAVARWQIPGPRILTSITQLSNKNPSPDSLRALVRSLKARGADVIKLFASAGLGAGGAADAVRRAARRDLRRGEVAGASLGRPCDQRGERACRNTRRLHRDRARHVRDEAELTLMAEHGTIFDPQVCLVFQNYIDHRDVYARSGFTERRSSRWRTRFPPRRRCSGRRSRRRA